MNKSKFKSLIATFLVLMLLTGTAFAGATDGLIYKSRDGRLTVWVPAKPQVTERDLPSTTGGPYKQIMVASESSPSIFLAGILDFRSDLATTGDETSYLDTMLGSMKAGFGNGFVIDKRDGSKDLVSSTGQKGRQIQGTVQGLRIIIRAFVGKHSIYMQQAAFPISYKDEGKNANRFLDSFVIAD